MKVDLSLQFEHDLTLPAHPVKVFTGSALPLELVGIPDRIGGRAVEGVSVGVVNADGRSVQALCERRSLAWTATFAPSCFETYGYVQRGFKVYVSLGSDEVIVGGDLEVAAGSPQASAGSAQGFYQLAGGDVYRKSTVVDGVQHFVKEQMVYDGDIGWGLEWVGDFIQAADGTFKEV
jgi:hypothetical protein